MTFASQYLARMTNQSGFGMRLRVRYNTEMVTSVAFSSDRIHVVSGSSDKSVRIWSTITGESTLLSEYKFCEMQDGSKVAHIFPGRVQIFSPQDLEGLVSRGKT